MGDLQSVLLIVDMTQLANNIHMEPLTETVISSTTSTAGIGQTVIGQFELEVIPVVTSNDEPRDCGKDCPLGTKPDW